jgi:hypothetical protein
MPAIKYATTLACVLLFLMPVFGDSYAPSRPQVFSSPSGKYLVRIEAADSVENARFYWKSTEFNVFSYNEEKDGYERVSEFDVEGHPLELFINDAGTHIISIDQQFGTGYGQIAAVYDFKGKRLAQWTLKDLFNVENLFDSKKLPKFRQSTSSIQWRGDAGWDYEQKKIWISAPTTFESRNDGSFTVTHPVDMDSYEIDFVKLQMSRIPAKNKKSGQ